MVHLANMYLSLPAVVAAFARSFSSHAGQVPVSNKIRQ